MREEVKGGEYLYIYVRENYNKLPYYSFLIIFLTQKFVYITISPSFHHNIIYYPKYLFMKVSNSK